VEITNEGKGNEDQQTTHHMGGMETRIGRGVIGGVGLVGVGRSFDIGKSPVHFDDHHMDRHVPESVKRIKAQGNHVHQNALDSSQYRRKGLPESLPPGSYR
jgi:hypothetical protein